MAGGALARPVPAAGRQVDLAPRLPVRAPDLRRDVGRRASGGRRRPAHRHGLRRARRVGRASRAGPLAHPRAGPRRAPAPARNPRLRQRRHRLAPDDGRRRRPRNRRDLRRRRVPAQAADEPHPRSAPPDGGRGPVPGRGRALPDHPQGRAGPRPDPLPDPRRLGADQVGRAARRPQRARNDDRDRGRSLARPYREDAGPFRRGGDGRRRGRRPPHRARRAAGTQAAAGRRAGRPVVGGVPDRRGADRPRLGRRGRRRDDEPAPRRACSRPCSRWGPTSKFSTGAAKAARRWRTCACGRAG